MKTIVLTSIVDEQWQATTPHVPSLIACDPKEHIAVNKLIEQIREYQQGYGDKPVPWIAEPSKANGDADTMARKLSGCWPINIQPIDEPITNDSPESIEQQKGL